MHFYKTNGVPMHTVIGANKKERGTTIADARKLGLLPSVTTVLDVQNKPALVEWLQQELLSAALTSPFHPEEYAEEDWKRKMLGRMRNKSNAAAARGTEIHDKLDNYFKNKLIDNADRAVITPTIQYIEETFGAKGWVSERSFARCDLGFAGCVDLHHPEKKLVIDFKTKDKASLDNIKQYDDHKLQLAAYQVGLELPRGTRRFNMFISTQTGEFRLMECSEFSRYSDMFFHLHSFWMLKNKYDPRRKI